jgi:hypothetical protein
MSDCLESIKKCLKAGHNLILSALLYKVVAVVPDVGSSTSHKPLLIHSDAKCGGTKELGDGCFGQ